MSEYRPPHTYRDPADEFPYNAVSAMAPWLGVDTREAHNRVAEHGLAKVIEDRKAELEAHGYDEAAEMRKRIAATETRIRENAREETIARLNGDPRACLAYLNSRR